jgi:hypothetical protein
MWRLKLSNTNKNNPTVLGGSSLKDKLSLARKQLGELYIDDNVDSKLDESCLSDRLAEESEVNIKIIPKFHLTGRCNRKLHKYTVKAFYVLENLDNEIKKYCNGGDVAIFNYLMHLGLNEIKKREGQSFDEVSSMEDSYSNIT